MNSHILLLERTVHVKGLEIKSVHTLKTVEK